MNDGVDDLTSVICDCVLHNVTSRKVYNFEGDNVEQELDRFYEDIVKARLWARKQHCDVHFVVGNVVNKLLLCKGKVLLVSGDELEYILEIIVTIYNEDEVEFVFKHIGELKCTAYEADLLD